MRYAAIGIDIGKSVFHLVALDAEGRVALRRKVSRRKLFDLLAGLEPALVGMEASCGAHHIARTLRDLGHDARLIPAQFVKPVVKSQKNDALDAEAIAEAVRRPTMRFVPIKTDEQLDLQALHRVRDRLVARRTAVINQIRSFLLERGLPLATGRLPLARAVPELLGAGADDLSPRLRRVLGLLWEEWRATDAQIAALTGEVEAVCREDEACRRLAGIPGIGPMAATALVAAVADGSAHARARDLSAWLGLVPQQRSTGGKARLGGISKRGNPYLRKLLIVGAQSVRLNLDRSRHPRLGAWLTALEKRAHGNVAVVALANKIARMPGPCSAAAKPTRRGRSPRRRADGSAAATPREAARTEGLLYSAFLRQAS